MGFFIRMVKLDPNNQIIATFDSGYYETAAGTYELDLWHEFDRFFDNQKDDCRVLVHELDNKTQYYKIHEHRNGEWGWNNYDNDGERARSYHIPWKDMNHRYQDLTPLVPPAKLMT